MKDYKCKSTLVNGKVDNDLVSVNPCVPVQFDLFEDVVQSQVIACYNCINVTLEHKDPFVLESFCKRFREFVSPKVSLVVLQACRVHSFRYTVVSNKNMKAIHAILFDFEETTLDDYNFRMLY